MRRLPVYLLLDTSGSMCGEPIEAVKNGVQTLVSALRQDPYALETAHLSVITFSNKAQQVVPLSELPQFQLPNIQASGGTSMGEALALVAQRRDAEVVKSTTEVKGDWKPLVFLMTDGEPTDNFDRGVTEFQKRKWGMVIACAAGPSANTENLKKLTEVVIRLDGASPAVFKAFFPRVSDSVSLGSKSIGSTGKEVTGLDQLSPPPPEIKVVP